MFWFFDIAACGILASHPGIELPPAALQEVLTTGPPGKWQIQCLVAQSCLTLGNPTDYTGSGDSPGKNTGEGCHALPQGIFPTQRLNSGLPHCRWILYRLSQQGSPRILESVAYPFSRGSSWPRNGTGISCIAGRFFTSWSYQRSPNLPLHLHKEREQQAYQARPLPLQATATLRLTFSVLAVLDFQDLTLNILQEPFPDRFPLVLLSLPELMVPHI